MNNEWVISAHDVASSRCTTVGADDDALVKLNCHDRGLPMACINNNKIMI
jgi:hypothetical protein